MISEGFRIDLNRALQMIAVKLDLDETRHEKAEKSYHAVGDWLSAESSPLQIYSPDIYPQGSFLLGTIVKPSEGDYDLDFVCLLGEGLGLSSQETYKLIGERLRANGTYASMLEPKNRCWRLVYAGDFHMDIIPAIPDLEQGNTAILVPDRDLADWTQGNPKGYAVWFKEKMHVQYDLVRASLARNQKKEIEEIPEHLVKTELQRAVQLMKRHRDIMFADNSVNMPISIIISTLAGHAYLDKGDLFEAIRGIVEGMPNHILDRDGEPWIENPTNPDENFADKWLEHPERRTAFYGWGENLQDDLERLAQCSSLDECEELLNELFGENVVSKIFKEIEHGSEIVVAPSRFDVHHKEQPKWIIRPSGKVNVRGFLQEENEEFFSDCEPLEKNEAIYFLARLERIDGDYEIHWQVVNTGEEAAAVEGGLRGEFYPCQVKKSHRRTERTQYKGMHWIEAFVIKDGICVARSGEFVVKIK